MRTRDVRLICRKEVVDILRDRRSVLATIVFPILFFPILMFLSERLEHNRQKELDTEIVSVAVLGDLTELEDRVAAIDGVQLTTEIDPREAIREERIDAALEVSPAEEGEEPPHVVLLTDRSRELSREAGGRLTTMLDRFQKEVRGERLATLGLAEVEQEILQVEESNLASDERMAGDKLGRIAPVILVFLLLNGASFAAVDLFAGERERKTLETLLTSLVDRRSVVVGKFITVVGMAVLSVLLFLLSSILSTRFGLATTDVAEAALAISPKSALLIAALLLSLGAFVSAVVVLVTSRARSFREAQTLLIPLLLIMLVPAGVATSPGVSLASAVAIVPVANVALAVREALVGHTPLIPFVVVFLSNALYAAWAIRRAVAFLESEAIVHGPIPSAGVSPGERTFAKEVAALYLVEILLLWYVGATMQAKSLLPGLLATLWGVLLIPTLFFARFYRIPFREAFHWKRASVSHLVGAALVAPAMLLLADSVFRLQSRFVPVPEEFFGEMEQLVQFDGNLTLMFFAVAFSPAICEELFFRGLLLSRHRKAMPAWRAVVIGGLLFGMFHLSIYRLLPTGLLGVAAGLVVLRSGSIFPAMVLHFVYNGLVLAMQRLPESVDLENIGVSWMGIIAVIAVVGVSFFRRPAASETWSRDPLGGG